MFLSLFEDIIVLQNCFFIFEVTIGFKFFEALEEEFKSLFVFSTSFLLSYVQHFWSGEEELQSFNEGVSSLSLWDLCVLSPTILP